MMGGVQPMPLLKVCPTQRFFCFVTLGRGWVGGSRLTPPPGGSGQVGTPPEVGCSSIFGAKRRKKFDPKIDPVKVGPQKSGTRRALSPPGGGWVRTLFPRALKKPLTRPHPRWGGVGWLAFCQNDWLSFLGAPTPPPPERLC